MNKKYIYIFDIYPLMKKKNEKTTMINKEKKQKKKIFLSICLEIWHENHFVLNPCLTGRRFLI